MQKDYNAEFTKKMRKTHTIYMPDMLHEHNDLLKAAFAYGGYHLEVVPEYHNVTPRVNSVVNRDYCACARDIVGQLLTFVEELRSGQDSSIDRIAFLEPQAGGACRAGNYYNLIIDCLRKTGYGSILVLSLNVHGSEKHSGFSINVRLMFAAVAAVCYSDMLMTLTEQIRPYEKEKGQTVALRQKWIDRLAEDIAHGRHLIARKGIYESIISDFQKIERDIAIQKKKVGITGEIYVKYSPVGNHHLEQFLEEQGGDYRHLGFINYCIYAVFSEMKSIELEKKSAVLRWLCQRVLNILLHVQKEVNQSITDGGFLADGAFEELHAAAKNIISDYYTIGDGWLIAGEIINLIGQGYDRILVVHPFACLVSHVGERGILKRIHELYPDVKVTSVEYDSDQSEALRESRIMLAIS